MNFNTLFFCFMGLVFFIGAIALIRNQMTFTYRVGLIRFIYDREVFAKHPEFYQEFDKVEYNKMAAVLMQWPWTKFDSYFSPEFNAAYKEWKEHAPRD